MRVPVGYGVEIGMMVDALRLVGLDALAEAADAELWRLRCEERPPLQGCDFGR